MIAVTGSTGLLGAALIDALSARGDEVSRLVRGACSGEDEVAWNPGSGIPDAGRLEGLDALVHLAGENIAGKRWTPAQKARIRDSRVASTEHLTRDLARLDSPPKAYVGASAIGFYGDRGVESVDESSGPGAGFLPEVCRDWEAAASELAEVGSRVTHLRFGVILTPDGGALRKMLLPFKLGVGGVVGSGRQIMSWVSLRDAVRAVLHAIDNPEVRGAVNVVAPETCSNAEFTHSLGRALRRPTVLPMPAFAARLAFGELADNLLLASCCVRSGVLERTGFEFLDPKIQSTLQGLLGRSTT